MLFDYFFIVESVETWIKNVYIILIQIITVLHFEILGIK